MPRFMTFSLLLLVSPTILLGADPPNVELFEWERGFAVRSKTNPDMAVYLWFYEWNMFEAIKPGQHTNGTYQLEHKTEKSGQLGIVDSDALRLEMTAAENGADLKLTVKNLTDYEFPRIAAVIPCFNPGPEKTRNRQLANTNTYFLAKAGLEQLNKREIHYNDKLRGLVDREAVNGKYVWSNKWPKNESNAIAGLIIRESNDGKWACGIAWEDFLSAQGHNPWECMHLSVRIGPMKPGESKTIRGRIYLLPGKKHDVLQRYHADFAAPTVGSKRD